MLPFIMVTKVFNVQLAYVFRLISTIIIMFIFFISAYAQKITTPPKVPSAHPRLFILPEQIAEIKSKISRPEFQIAKLKVYNSSMPACLAFQYLMEGDALVGRSALNNAYNQLKTVTKYSQNRPPFKSVFNAAIAFDYCYNLFGKGGVPSKTAFIAELQRVCALGPGAGKWAPVSQTLPTLVGHFVEGVFYNQVFTGLAVYGDDNTLYDSAIKFLLNRIQSENDFWFPSHMHHQGAYIGTRHSHTLLTALAFRTLTQGKDLFSPDLNFVPYQLLYFMRPDRQLMRVGDVSEDRGRFEYLNFVSRQTANYFNDPYLRWLSEQNIFGSYAEEIEAYFFDLIYRPSNAVKKSPEELPLTKYFPEPIGGDMIARTGWDFSGPYSQSAMVHMRIGNYYFGNHQHKDFGTFQIYYKGNLTGDAGMYQGTESKASSDFWVNYHRSTIAHNGLLIYNPAEKYSGGNWTNTQVDGGMRWPLNDDVQPDNLNMLLNEKNGYQYANVIGYDFGPDKIKPEFSYISGDLTKGYNYANSLNPNKVRKVTRSMVTLNAEGTEYPCFFVVYDRIEATNANFKKTFLMHSLNQPSLNGNKATILHSSTQGGKLVSYTLLPENPQMKTVEGYKINGISYNPGTKSNSAYEGLKWSLEISPSEKNLNDEFLHAMAVMDGNQDAPAAEKIISEHLVGAKIMDKVVMFDRKGSTLAQAEFNINQKGTYAILICDILPGEWLIEKDGHQIGIYTASDTGKNLYFKGSEGYYTITNLSNDISVSSAETK